MADSYKNQTSPDSNPPPAGAEQPAEGEIKTLLSEQLFAAGTNEVRIVHAGKTYRLLRTRNSKLILIK